MNPRTPRAFTLIKLLVVIAILAILADRLPRHQKRIEAALFSRVKELFSLPTTVSRL